MIILCLVLKLAGTCVGTPLGLKYAPYMCLEPLGLVSRIQAPPDPNVELTSFSSTRQRAVLCAEAPFVVSPYCFCLQPAKDGLSILANYWGCWGFGVWV